MERKLRFFEEQILKEKALTKVLNATSLLDASNHSSNINVDELEVLQSL